VEERPARHDQTATSDAKDRPATRPSSAVAALPQLYRGELGRMTSYRRRLDTTTNWAISVVGAAISLTLGSDALPHTVLLVAMVLVFIFLIFEARRFRHYEVSRFRVQLLERGYLTDALTGNTAWPWLDSLLDHLRAPRPPLDAWAAIGWRLRRNYLWIYLVMLLSWLFKLALAATPTGIGEVLTRAGTVLLPGWIVITAVVVFYAVLVGLAASAARRYPHGEDW
jgi:uncharacterized membrane protein